MKSKGLNKFSFSILLPDEGRLEVRGDGDRSTAALHFLPGDDSGYHRDPDGRTSHLRVRGPGSYNRDLSWKINTI